MAEGNYDNPIAISSTALPASEYINNGNSAILRTGNFKLFKLMIGSLQTQIPTGTFTDIGTIPEGYRPYQETNMYLTDGTERVLITLNTNGTITAYKYTSGDFVGYYIIPYI